MDMGSKVNSFEDKVKLPVTETISRFYQPQGNRKAIRILTVAVYVLCVSLAAIMLSLYYIFIWDPTIKTFIPGKPSTNCDKFIIPEQIAIRLINSTEISVEQFYKNILVHYQLNHKQHWRKKAIQNEENIKNFPKTITHAATTTHVPTNPKQLNHIIGAFSKIREDDEDYSDMDILESSGQYTKI